MNALAQGEFSAAESGNSEDALRVYALAYGALWCGEKHDFPSPGKAPYRIRRNSRGLGRRCGADPALEGAWIQQRRS